MKTQIAEITCPVCKATELHSSGMLQIRACKVCKAGKWYSQCLVCSGAYDKVDGEYDEANYDSGKGWFV